jgi:hypothetical protein
VPGAATISRDVRVARAAPGVFAVVAGTQAITVWATGLGSLPAPIWARVGGVAAPVLFAGASAQFPGLVQVNIAVPAGTQGGGQPLEAGLEGAPPFFTGRVELPRVN